MKKLLDTKWGYLLLMTTASFALSAALGWFLCALSGDTSFSGFSQAFQTMFFWFAFPLPLSGMFMILGIARDHEYEFANGLYYGGAFAVLVLDRFFKIPASDETTLVVGYIFAALVCYVVWLKQGFGKNKNDRH